MAGRHSCQSVDHSVHQHHTGHSHIDLCSSQRHSPALSGKVWILSSEYQVSILLLPMGSRGILRNICRHPHFSSSQCSVHCCHTTPWSMVIGSLAQGRKDRLHSQAGTSTSVCGPWVHSRHLDHTLMSRKDQNRLLPLLHTQHFEDTGRLICKQLILDIQLQMGRL